MKRIIFLFRLKNEQGQTWGGKDFEIVNIIKRAIRAMKRSILIVDDDKNTCSSIARALSGDYKTYTACNGDEALEILDGNNEIKIILSDMVMPGMNGLELLEKIHLKDHRNIVIMITGYTELESTIEAKHLGVHDYLMKPVDLNKLDASIKNAIEKMRTY